MELGYVQDLTELMFIIIIHTWLKTGMENKRDESNLIKWVLGIICKVQKIWEHIYSI